MNIAFLGDSITYGYALEDRLNAYPSLVCRKLGAEEENYGITGTLMAQAGLNRSDLKDYVSRIRLIDEADVAVVFGGTNDYFWSDRPIAGENDEYFAHAVETMCKHIQNVRRGKITLFLTPYPHNGVGNYEGGETWNTSSRHDTDQKNFNGHILEDYVTVLEEVCGKYGIPCRNLHRDFAFHWRTDTSDGCHPNEEGHRKLAAVVVQELKKLLG